MNDSYLAAGETVEHFFRTTVPRRPSGRFNFKNRGPAARPGIRLLFQYKAKIVAVASLIAKHGRDQHSPNDSQGWLSLDLGTLRFLGKPIGQAEFGQLSGKTMNQRMHLLEHNESAWRSRLS
jgi:hypothetical protein